MNRVKFTVDSALLRELGERLVGHPHIALAELVKNSYDADAKHVEIRFEDDSIEVVDDGNGMTWGEFEGFWMRVGSPHKQQQGLSKRFERPLTGSKGIGRLSVQFLASELTVESASIEADEEQVTVSVDWREAISAGDLTEATAEYVIANRSVTFANGSSHGTRLLLQNLNQIWLPADLKALAREIWTLNSPFEDMSESDSFNVFLRGAEDDAVDAFRKQVRAYSDLWQARVTGVLHNRGGEGTVHLTIEFQEDHSKAECTYRTPREGPCLIGQMDFDIRVFNWQRRQKEGIKVDDAREYFNRYGGVYLYDAGFRLPYYGPDQDWLGIEFDHAHRLSRSKLLPKTLQVVEGLNNLPTNSRLLGEVRVNTGLEGQQARVEGREDHLAIQVTRDRLLDNPAYRQLRDAVRWALDFYATEETRRRLSKAEKKVERTRREALPRIRQVLKRYEASIPAAVKGEIETALEAVERTDSGQRSLEAARAGLLGTLATAGITALALEHETARGYSLLATSEDQLVRGISALEAKHGIGETRQFVRALETLRSGLRIANHSRLLFKPLLDDENRERAKRLRVRPVVEDAVRQASFFLRGIDTQSRLVDDEARFPAGSLVEWQALLQNVLTNAANAMAEQDRPRRIEFSTHSVEGSSRLRIEDTGAGVDLATADRLFEPFVRQQFIADERKGRGLGGAGLGLAIVKMIAEANGCRVRFVKPRGDFGAALEVTWQDNEKNN
jgi:signal transduction histidine kinase